MRVLLYMGFTTPPNVFNELKKENTFWYTDQHNKDGKTLTEKPHIRQLLSESRLTDLSDISRKLNQGGVCFWGVLFKEDKLMGNEHKRLYEPSQELSPESLLDCSLVYTMKSLNQTSLSSIETFSDANSLISL